MKLSDVWMVVVFLALAMYIVLDGYTLGTGVLTLLDRDGERRPEMHEQVSWFWDGNESWLVLLALALRVGAPEATGVALPALYVPVMLMLLSLIVRGVSLELIDQHDGWHPLWGRLFGLGSLVTAFSQGAAFGGLIAGLPVRGGQFAGGPFTFLHDGYAVLTGLTAVILYLLAGCSFVWFKSDGDTRRYAGRVGRRIVVALAVFTVASWLLAPVVGLLRLQPLRQHGCRSGLPARSCLLRAWWGRCARSRAPTPRRGPGGRPLWRHSRSTPAGC